MNYIVTSETKNPIALSSVLYADQYFQMTFNNPWAGEAVDRLFINPYQRTYYLKHYATDYKKLRKAIPSASFIQFEGMKELIEDFKEHAY